MGLRSPCFPGFGASVLFLAIKEGWRSLNSATLKSVWCMVPRIYLKSAALMLFITAAGKVATALGQTASLDAGSPLFSGISNRHLILTAAAFEVAVAGVAISGWGEQRLAVIGVAWLATIFLGYRLMLSAQGLQGHCNCLGEFSAAFLTAEEAEQISTGILGYLLLGSYGILLTWRVWTHRNTGRDDVQAGAGEG
jgi:hypothetical protein